MRAFGKRGSYLTMASSGVECVLCPFMLGFPHDSFLCYSTIQLTCHSNAYGQWFHAGCSFSAVKCFLKETHTWKWNFWNNSWMLSRGTLATCANTLLFSNMGTNSSYLSLVQRLVSIPTQGTRFWVAGVGDGSEATAIPQAGSVPLALSGLFF